MGAASLPQRCKGAVTCFECQLGPGCLAPCSDVVLIAEGELPSHRRPAFARDRGASVPAEIPRPYCQAATSSRGCCPASPSMVCVTSSCYQQREQGSAGSVQEACRCRVGGGSHRHRPANSVRCCAAWGSPGWHAAMQDSEHFAPRHPTKGINYCHLTPCSAPQCCRQMDLSRSN